MPRRTLGTSRHRQCRPGDGSRTLRSKCCRETGRHCTPQLRPRPRQQQCGRMPNPIACGRHDDGRPTLTGQLPRPMGFVHRHPQQRRFPQALARQGGTTPGMPRLRPHTGPTQGGAFFVRLNSSLLRRLAHCPLRQLPVRYAQAPAAFLIPLSFIGGLVHVHITFVL